MRRRPKGRTQPRFDHAVGYFDEQLRRVVLVGGEGQPRAGERDRVWSWSGTRWELAYDRSRGQVVLFGGVGAPSGPGQDQAFLADMWIWQDGRWRKAADLGPRGRYAHGMVFDERAGVVLLYSGSAAHRNAPLDDMWQWDGTRWTEIALTAPTPGHRYQPVMVYDRARGRTVLYGGLQGPSFDTWEWDGKRWTAIAP